jgi:hypothetical protein
MSKVERPGAESAPSVAERPPTGGGGGGGGGRKEDPRGLAAGLGWIVVSRPAARPGRSDHEGKAEGRHQAGRAGDQAGKAGGPAKGPPGRTRAAGEAASGRVGGLPCHGALRGVELGEVGLASSAAPDAPAVPAAPACGAGHEAGARIGVPRCATGGIAPDGDDGAVRVTAPISELGACATAGGGPCATAGGGPCATVVAACPTVATARPTVGAARATLDAKWVPPRTASPTGAASRLTTFSAVPVGLGPLRGLAAAGSDVTALFTEASARPAACVTGDAAAPAEELVDAGEEATVLATLPTCVAVASGGASTLTVRSAGGGGVRSAGGGGVACRTGEAPAPVCACVCFATWLVASRTPPTGLAAPAGVASVVMYRDPPASAPRAPARIARAARRHARQKGRVAECTGLPPFAHIWFGLFPVWGFSIRSDALSRFEKVANCMKFVGVCPRAVFDSLVLCPHEPARRPPVILPPWTCASSPPRLLAAS